MKTCLPIVAITLLASPAFGQIVVDGVRDEGYGAALVVQDTATGFGDSNLGAIDYANGSELDAAYGFVQDGWLRLFFAGNLESNFNKLEIFIDALPGGQNRLLGNNPDVDFNGLNRMGDDGTGNGLRFDDGFEPDRWFSLTCGGAPFAFYFNAADLLTEGGGTGSYLGSGSAGAAGAFTSADGGVVAAIDNSNIAGVTGVDACCGADVTTGIELALFLPPQVVGDLKVCVFVNGGGHDWLSNQCLGGMAGFGNLGEPRFVDFNFVDGLQYFTVANGGGGNPCPADLDGDGSVAGSDLGVLLGDWGGSTADIDGDGTVAGSDLGIMLGAWGACP